MMLCGILLHGYMYIYSSSPEKMVLITTENVSKHANFDAELHTLVSWPSGHPPCFHQTRVGHLEPTPQPPPAAEAHDLRGARRPESRHPEATHPRQRVEPIPLRNAPLHGPQGGGALPRGAVGEIPLLHPRNKRAVVLKLQRFDLEGRAQGPSEY